MKILLLSALVILVLHGAASVKDFCGGRSDSECCQGMPDGEYCTNDLSGFHTCKGGKHTVHSCRRKKQCQCQFNKKCLVPKNQICTKLEQPALIMRNFIMSAFAIETIVDADGNVKTQNLHGYAVRNAELGMFKRERWTGDSNRRDSYRFEVFNFQENGKYMRYFGNFDVCKKAVVDDLPILGDNYLKFYQKVDMVQLPCGTIEETWKLQDGRIKYGDELSKLIQVVQRVKDEEGNEVLIPTVLTIDNEFKDGSSNKQMWRSHWVDLIKVPKSFFDLPKHC
uniref:Uncharacterized protein n=1 Tax=Clytia hemisphaerica TaxID=252671 RepID=A0A7M5XA05_9CNID